MGRVDSSLVWCRDRTDYVECMGMRNGMRSTVALLGALVFVFAVGCSSDSAATSNTPAPASQRAATPTPQVTEVGGETVVVLHITTPAGDQQTGTAVLTSNGDQTTIEVNVEPSAPEAQPMHVHFGTCARIGNIAHDLENVIRGHSLTILDVPLNQLTTIDRLINIHVSFNDFPTSTGCVELPIIPG